MESYSTMTSRLPYVITDVSSDVGSNTSSMLAAASMATACPRLTERLVRTSTMTVIFAVAYCAIFVCGVVANVLVIGIVASKKSLQTTTNFFIVNLAVADLLVLVCVLPITLLTSLFDGWEYGSVACKTVPYVQGVSVCASINSITAIAFDRYFAICHSFSAVPLRQHMRLVVASVWLVAMVIMAPWLFAYDLREVQVSGYPGTPDCSIVYCGQHWPGGVRQEGIFYAVAIFALCYGLPLVTITIVYLFIVCHVWRSDGPLLAGSIKSGHALRQSRRQVLRMILVLSAFFALSWLPFHIVYLTYYFHSPQHSEIVIGILSTFQPFAQLLSASNSCVNPIIYSFVSRKWRTEFKRLCSVACIGGNARQLATPPDYTTRRLTARLTSNGGSECGTGGGALNGKCDDYCLRELNNGYGSVRLVVHVPKKNSTSCIN